MDIFHGGFSPYITYWKFKSGNSGIFPLLLLLSSIGNSLDSFYGKYPSKDCLDECFVDRDSCDNCSDIFGASCFTTQPQSGYWKVKECSSDFGP